MKTRTNQPIYNDNGKLAQDMPNTSASDSGKVLGIDESGKVVPVSSGTKLYRHELTITYNPQEQGDLQEIYLIFANTNPNPYENLDNLDYWKYLIIYGTLSLYGDYTYHIIDISDGNEITGVATGAGNNCIITEGSFTLDYDSDTDVLTDTVTEL